MKPIQVIAVIASIGAMSMLYTILYKPEWYYPAQVKLQSDTSTTQFLRFGMNTICCDNASTDLVCKSGECYDINNDCTINNSLTNKLIPFVENCNLFIAIRSMILASTVLSTLAVLVGTGSIIYTQTQNIKRNIYVNSINLVVALHSVSVTLLCITSAVCFSVLIKNEHNTLFSGMDTDVDACKAGIGYAYYMNIGAAVFSLINSVLYVSMYVKPPLEDDENAMYRLIPDNA